MFGRCKHFSPENVCRTEDLSPREVVHFRVVEETDENGCFKHRVEGYIRKTDVPFTPQSGMDVHLGDLAFAVRAGLAVDDSPAYLSIAKQGNPFVESQYVKNISDMFNEKFKENETD